MRPRVFLLAISAVSCLVVATGNATAGVTTDLLFTSHNGSAIAPTDTVTAAAGDTLAMAVRFTNDQGLTNIVFSLNYDLDGKSELTPTSAGLWPGVELGRTPEIVRFEPRVGLEPPTSTFVGSFQGTVNPLSTTLTLPNGTYEIGSVNWTVGAGVSTDGADILSGLFNTNIDGVFGAGFLSISNQVLFHGATVNAIPEPGTAGLLGLGLVGLAAAGRRPLS